MDIAVATGTFGLALMLAEIFTISRDADTRDAATRQMLGHLETLVAQVKTDAGLRMAKRGTLKDRILELSSKILQFLSEREQSDPGRSNFFRSMARIEDQELRTRRWLADTEIMTNYLHRTLQLFDEQFSVKAANARDDLKKHGLEDKQLDQYLAFPCNTMGIRSIAQTLGALAMRLDDNVE